MAGPWDAGRLCDRAIPPGDEKREGDDGDVHDRHISSRGDSVYSVCEREDEAECGEVRKAQSRGNTAGRHIECCNLIRPMFEFRIWTSQDITHGCAAGRNT